MYVTLWWQTPISLRIAGRLRLINGGPLGETSFCAFRGENRAEIVLADQQKQTSGLSAATGTRLKRLTQVALGRLGPGLITGAADDDPSGIATYSQAGAHFGLDMLLPMLFTYPLMVAVQAISARVGRVTGTGLASSLAQVFPRPIGIVLVAALFIANTINIGADIAAMGAAAQLLAGWGQVLFAVMFALLSGALQILVSYRRYAKGMKWLTLVLLSYVAIAFTVQITWADVFHSLFLPHMYWSSAWVTVIVAVFGTTISPYLFFWQSSEEVEIMDLKNKVPLTEEPRAARRELNRMGADTFVGMGVSNLIAFFIILTTALTLHNRGITDIQTSTQAAQALRPIVGNLAFVVFSLGVIGTGLLAVPVLAGSTAYAAAETFGWSGGLEKSWGEAPAFYGVIVASMVLAIAVIFSPLDPIKALFWSAVLNGVISVPILFAMMLIASRRDEMGVFVATRSQRVLGWATTLVMGAAVVAMLVL